VATASAAGEGYRRKYNDWYKCRPFCEVSGLQYVIINSPPALGVVHDAAGHERPEAIRKYQVCRQNMTETNQKVTYIL
jgi:hypothetical protein